MGGAACCASLHHNHATLETTTIDWALDRPGIACLHTDGDRHACDAAYGNPSWAARRLGD